MTIKHRMLLGAIATGVLATSLFGQTPTPTPTPVPADPPPPPLIPAAEPATPPPAPTKQADKKTPAPKKPATTTTTTKKPTEPANRSFTKLKPGQAVATEKNVNVRGQAALNSEIVTHLKRGDVVTVLEQINTKAPASEPSEWAKILLPPGSAVWVHSSFLDAKKSVKSTRLNLRSGPGENYSILGRIDKGTVVHELERKGEWVKVEAPTNAYAFAWARLFSQAPAHLAAANAAKAKEKPVETAAVTPPPVIVTAPPNETPAQAPVAPPSTPVSPTTAPTPPDPPPAAETPPAAPTSPEEVEPLIKRVVTREGTVKGTVSIQAPSYYVLRSLDNNKAINYLHTTDTNIVLRSFIYQRVLVTGEEMLDERWPNTPVIDVESIEAVP